MNAKDIFISLPAMLLSIALVVLAVISIENFGHPTISTTMAIIFFSVWLVQIGANFYDILKK